MGPLPYRASTSQNHIGAPLANSAGISRGSTRQFHSLFRHRALPWTRALDRVRSHLFRTALRAGQEVHTPHQSGAQRWPSRILSDDHVLLCCRPRAMGGDSLLTKPKRRTSSVESAPIRHDDLIGTQKMCLFDLLVVIHIPASRSAVAVLLEDCLAVCFHLHACAEQERMNPIGVAPKNLVSRFHKVEEFLKVLQEDQESTHVVLRSLSETWMHHVLPTSTFRVVAVGKLATGPSIRSVD